MPIKLKRIINQNDFEETLLFFKALRRLWYFFSTELNKNKFIKKAAKELNYSFKIMDDLPENMQGLPLFSIKNNNFFLVIDRFFLNKKWFKHTLLGFNFIFFIMDIYENIHELKKVLFKVPFETILSFNINKKFHDIFPFMIEFFKVFPCVNSMLLIKKNGKKITSITYNLPIEIDDKTSEKLWDILENNPINQKILKEFGLTSPLFSSNMISINVFNEKTYGIKLILDFKYNLTGILKEVFNLKLQIIKKILEAFEELNAIIKREGLFNASQRINTFMLANKDSKIATNKAFEIIKKATKQNVFFIVFKPGINIPKLWHNNIDLNILSNAIKWDLITEKRQTLSSIIYDYTLFDSETKIFLKKLYYFPVFMLGSIYCLAVFDIPFEKLGFNSEDIKIIQLIINNVVQNILLYSKVEELERIKHLAGIGQMAATIAHEIRNPIGGLSITMSFLEREIKDKNKKKMLKNAIDAIQSVNKLITEFLNFSKGWNIDKKTCSLKKIIEDVVLLYSSKLKEKRIKLSLLYANLPNILIDPERIKQAVSNILINAIEASENGSEISIKTGITRGYQYIEIKDQGCGIPNEILNKIFEPFYTTKTKGIGLGLAITKKIIDAHKGKIEVSNQNNTTFRILLPFNQNI